jgi:hypothetical protein
MVDRAYLWFCRLTLVGTEIMLAMVLAVDGDSLVGGQSQHHRRNQQHTRLEHTLTRTAS